MTMKNQESSMDEHDDDVHNVDIDDYYVDDDDDDNNNNDYDEELTALTTRIIKEGGKNCDEKKNNSVNNNNKSSSSLLKMNTSTSSWKLLILICCFVILIIVISSSTIMIIISNSSSNSSNSSNTKSQQQQQQQQGTPTMSTSVTDTVTATNNNSNNNEDINEMDDDDLLLSSSSSSLSSLLLFKPSLLTIEELKNSKSNNNKSKSKKSKFFVMHIGPHKTATTSIQKDSGLNINYTQTLFNDKVIYVGRNWKKNQIRNNQFKQIKICMMDVHNNEIDGRGRGEKQNDEEKMNNKDSITLLLLDCWRGINGISRIISMTPEYSLIDSDEMYMSSDWNSPVGIQHIEELRTIFVDYLYYDEFIIVGAYRRYIQWLPSTYRQITGNSPGCLSTLHKNGGLLLYPNNNGHDDDDNNKDDDDDDDDNNKNDDDDTSLESPNLMNRRCRNIWNDYSLDLIQRKENENSVEEQGDQNQNDNDNDNDNEFYGYERIINHNGDVETIHNIDGMIPYIQPLIGKPGFDDYDDNGGGGGGMKILNYFQQSDENENNEYEYYNSITTEFYCKVLGMDRTPNTCLYSKNLSSQEIKIFNKRSIISVIYDDILMEAVQRNFKIQDSYSNSNSNSNVEHDSSDSDSSISDSISDSDDTTTSTTLSRSQLRRNLAEYHHEILLSEENNNNNNNDNNRFDDDDYTATADNNSNTTTTTPTTIISSAMIMKSLPLICPPKNELQLFLKKSLQFEDLIYNTFDFNNLNLNLNNSNKSSSSTIKINRRRRIRIAEHTKQFYKMIYDEKSFCWIDTDRLFYNVTSYKQLLEERLIINNW